MWEQTAPPSLLPCFPEPPPRPCLPLLSAPVPHHPLLSGACLHKPLQPPPMFPPTTHPTAPPCSQYLCRDSTALRLFLAALRTPMQPHCNPNATSLQPYCNPTTTPLQPHYNPTTTPLQHHCNLTAILQQPHCTPRACPRYPCMEDRAPCLSWLLCTPYYNPTATLL